jgi:hypothetical protein
MKYVMQIICAYCKRKMGEKPSQHPGVSHSICAACLKEQERLLTLLLEETEGGQTIPFMGEPMYNREVSMRDYYGV